MESDLKIGHVGVVQFKDATGRSIGPSQTRSTIK